MMYLIFVIEDRWLEYFNMIGNHCLREVPIWLLWGINVSSNCDENNFSIQLYIVSDHTHICSDIFNIYIHSISGNDKFSNVNFIISHPLYNFYQYYSPPCIFIYSLYECIIFTRLLRVNNRHFQWSYGSFVRNGIDRLANKNRETSRGDRGIRKYDISVLRYRSPTKRS